jgi:GDP/UDP-N,N'-diacetylbacillosamine 2-epimerase (hydrolysing)
MQVKRKVCFVTGTRADYGILHPLIKKVQISPVLDVDIIATGMHLSTEFGLTYKQIINDGFVISKKVEMLLSSDTSVGITKSMGLGLIGFSDALSELTPDLIIILGDRFESLVAAIAATVARIPIAHLYGGETTEGAYDESFRHSITKMSHLHFTAAEEYKNRVVQLGENPNRVYNVGYMGIDNIKKLDLISKSEFEKSINFKLSKRNLLVTFHPVTLESLTSENQFVNLLSALDKLKDTNLIFTKANADTNGRIINRLIDKYVAQNNKISRAFDSLGQIRYLTAMRYVDGVIGNSSSGLTEAPSFGIGTVNIGDRQKGRVNASSVINCLPFENEISKAIEKLYSLKFTNDVQNTISPFGSGNSSEKIISTIEKNIGRLLLKKSFYNLK